MKKHNGKLPPLQNAYNAQEKPKMQAYTSNLNVRDDSRNANYNQNYNSNPSYFQKQTQQPNSSQNANANVNAQKIKQEHYQ